MAIILLFIKTIIQRFLEILLSCVVVSAAVTGIYITDIVTTNDVLYFSVITGVIIFWVVNIIRLRQRYSDWASNLLYFIVNIPAYMLFAITSFIVYAFSDEAFTWMFAITKFARYSNIALATPYSTLIFHALSLLVIFFAPTGMKWVFADKDDDERDNYYDSYDEI